MYDDLADGGVEGGEKLVFGKDIALGKKVDERGLPDVGISYERHTDHPAAVLPLRGFLPFDVGKALFEERHAVEDDAAVHFELCLARTSQAHTSAFASSGTSGATALTLKVRPKALQAGEHIAVLSQLHLRLGVGGLRPHGKDVEDEGSTVEDLHFQLLLDVPQLLGGKFVVEDDHSHGLWGFGVEAELRAEPGVEAADAQLVEGFVIFIDSTVALLDVRSDFLQFSRTEIGGCRRPVGALREAAHGDGSGSLGKERQLVEVFVRLALVLLTGNKGNEHAGFGLYGGGDEFFHKVLTLSVTMLHNESGTDIYGAKLR